MSLNKLPLTIQDDLEAKEKYAAQQRGAYCSPRKLRWWTIIALTMLATIGLLSWSSQPVYAGFVTGTSDSEIVQVPSEVQKETPLAEQQQQQQQEQQQEIPLIEEIANMIKENTLIVFSKTYCPFSLKAKKILKTYNLSKPLKVVEVDLRDDTYEVKQALGELSGRDTFPNIFLNRESIGGSDLLEELHTSGQLKLMLDQYHLLDSEKE